MFQVGATGINQLTMQKSDYLQASVAFMSRDITSGTTWKPFWEKEILKLLQESNSTHLSAIRHWTDFGTPFLYPKNNKFDIRNLNPEEPGSY
jgi:hypothetical protein